MRHACQICAPSPTAAKSGNELTRRQFGASVLGASTAALLAGCTSKKSAETQVAELSHAAAPSLPPDLEVVKRSKGPIMTVLEEFYKMGPGPSSSHTMGPMRITYDFFQRVSKLPEDQLKRATGLKVHLFGVLC